MSRRIATLILLLCPILLLKAQQDWEHSVREAFQQGRLQEARLLAEDALRNPTGAALAQEWLGRIALQEKHPEEAISHFQEASVKGHFSIEMARDWSSSLIDLGRIQEACDLLEKSITSDPTSMDFRYRLGVLYMIQAMPLKARPHLEEAYRGGLKHANVVL